MVVEVANVTIDVKVFTWRGRPSRGRLEEGVDIIGPVGLVVKEVMFQP